MGAQEFSALTPKNNVFKLVGPILMKQEPEEAKQNVDKRLEWIGGEVCVAGHSPPLSMRSLRHYWPPRATAPLLALGEGEGAADLRADSHSKRVETNLKDLETKLETKKVEVRPISHSYSSARASRSSETLHTV